jgi:hypothetical protein
VVIAVHRDPDFYWAPTPTVDPLFWWDLSWHADTRPVFYRDEEPPAPAILADAPPPPPDAEPAPAEEPDQPPPPPEPVGPPSLELPEPPDFSDLSDRGFFSGDDTVIQLALMDQATGQLLWSKVVHDDVDPLDPGEMKHLVDQALAGQSWAPSSAKSH